MTPDTEKAFNRDYIRFIWFDNVSSDQPKIVRKPVDTGRKLNVHKTLRRRPGRLLNVLCTFNLRPVSIGNRFARVVFGVTTSPFCLNGTIRKHVQDYNLNKYL